MKMLYVNDFFSKCSFQFSQIRWKNTNNYQAWTFNDSHFLDAGGAFVEK